MRGVRFAPTFLSASAIGVASPFFCFASGELVYTDLDCMRGYSTHFLGNFFPVFQNGFLSIILFILLFTIFQYWQNRRSEYLSYAFYLFIMWLYFLRIFPFYLYVFFSDKSSLCDFNYWLRNPGNFNDQNDFIFFCLLTMSYLLFISTFFDLKEKIPNAYAVIKFTIKVLLISTAIQIIVLFLTHCKGYLENLPETIIKFIFTLPAFWLMIEIGRAKLPGSRFILIGSGMMLAGGILVGILHFIGDTTPGKRLFIQMGMLIEILFFSAALGRKDYHLHLVLDNVIQDKEKTIQDKIKNEKHISIQNRIINKLNEYNKELQKKLKKQNHLPKPVPQNETFSEKLERTMNENFANPDFNVEKLAEAMNLTRRTLNRRIEERYEMSPIGYLSQYRIDKSKALMYNKDLNLNQIASMVGYTDYQQFSSMFKKKEGVSPKKFRKGLP